MKRQQNMTIWYQKNERIQASVAETQTDLAVDAQANKVVVWGEDWG
ncbi:unannotated protein [freshwater metagenome]|uniref:Unannotated protein n=1 Tax=freshwater metagenome TaxID=449393 RepID=A0A6J6B5V0_9ZZZZ